MRKDNPACYECPRGRQGLHIWTRNVDGTATCTGCKLVLSQSDADDVWDVPTTPAPVLRPVFVSPRGRDRPIVLHDIFIAGKWVGSCRTIAQCIDRLRFLQWPSAVIVLIFAFTMMK